MLDDNRSSGLGTSSAVMVMSHWRILLQANGRFQSNSETFVSSESRMATLDTNGSVGAGNAVAGTWAVYGNALIAEVPGKGRRVYTVKVSGGAMLLDGMLFVRP